MKIINDQTLTKSFGDCRLVQGVRRRTSHEARDLDGFDVNFRD